jgi:outer membrane usher protein
VVVLRNAAGDTWLEQDDFTRLRLRPPQSTPRSMAIVRNGLRYLPLSALAHATLAFDEAHQSLQVELPAGDFLPTHLSAQARTSATPMRATPGAFLNYQLSAQRVASDNIAGAEAELGVFAPAGVLVASAVARHLPGDNAFVRLDTTYTHDFIGRMERLQLGDAISDGGSWGTSARFAGLSWGRNFELRPDLLTTPLLSASGAAVLPSTVDVYVNNQRVTSQAVPPGPFIIDQLPAITGAGQVSIVVRDALGREQQVTQPFYSGLQQLAPGLSQYRVDVGNLRLDYAIASAHYGRLLASGTYRRGLADWLTAEAHGESLAHGARSAGLAVATSIGHVGLLNVRAASGGDANGSGTLLGAGFERRGRYLSLFLEHSHASDGYQQVSYVASPLVHYPDRDLAQVGLAMGRPGSLSLAWVRQSGGALPSQQTMSLGYSRNAGRNGSLGLTGTRLVTAGTTTTSVFLNFTYFLGGRDALLATASGGSGPGAPEHEVYATYSHSPPIGPGQGWRAGASTAGNFDADWRDQTTVGDLEAQAARNHGVAGASLYFTGAATYLGGQFNATRAVQDSFALVDIDGLAGVPVYLDNQLITHTDEHGRALLYNLRPYEANRIDIQPEELPLDTTIGARVLALAPGYRSGVVARFPVERVQGGVFRLWQEDGTPVPAGAIARFKGKDFPVTLDGMTYVTGYDHGIAGEARWEGHRCAFRLDPPPPGDPLPDMGRVNCFAPRAQGGAR